MKGCGALRGVILVEKELSEVALKRADEPAIRWQNVTINPIMTKSSSTMAANAFSPFPVRIMSNQVKNCLACAHPYVPLPDFSFFFAKAHFWACDSPNFIRFYGW